MDKSYLNYGDGDDLIALNYSARELDRETDKTSVELGGANINYNCNSFNNLKFQDSKSNNKYTLHVNENFGEKLVNNSNSMKSTDFSNENYYEKTIQTEKGVLQNFYNKKSSSQKIQASHYDTNNNMGHISTDLLTSNNSEHFNYYCEYDVPNFEENLVDNRHEDYKLRTIPNESCLQEQQTQNIALTNSINNEEHINADESHQSYSGYNNLSLLLDAIESEEMFNDMQCSKSADSASRKGGT